MAVGREHRRQENEVGTGLLGPAQLGAVMGGAGPHHRPGARPNGIRPSSRPKMDAGAERQGQPGVARDHQRQPPPPANPREVLAERPPVRFAVVAQHDAAQARRQKCHRGAGIGQTARIGEQPQHRHAPLPRRAVPPPRLDGTGPGDKFPIHADPRP